MSSVPRILLSPPDVSYREREALLAAFDSNWISTVGPAIDRFEHQMSEYLGRPCVALSSGTAAIHLALRLAGVQRGDVVLCQSFTFVASANPILYEGATPFFIDSEPRTWNMDADLLEEAIRKLIRNGKQPRAAILVHLYGMPAESARIASVCERYGVTLIEDAAESLGARVDGKPTGCAGTAAAFSFNGNKIITTAGGGILAFENERDAVLVRKWSTQSREMAIHYEHCELGFNYRMSNLLAAVGSAQLEGLADKVERRRQIAQYYRKAFQDVPELVMQAEWQNVYSTHWLSCVLIREPKRGRHAAAGSRRDALIRYLDQQNIESRPLWKPMHIQPLFRDAPYLGGTVCEALFRDGLCLPSSSALTLEEQNRVIDCIREFFNSEVCAGRVSDAVLGRVS
jgi:pyridoxal phosphate-dependent aminotransferase EpsN